MSGSISRRSFLGGLGALALSALPACRRAQQHAIAAEHCPEWALPGDTTCFATCMPWPGGAYPLLAVCHGGVPTSLQAHPQYHAQSGLPALVQASLLELYDPARPATPTLGGRRVPWPGVRNSFRAWARAIQAGRRTAFLFPAGYSAVRTAQEQALSQLPNVACYEYDPLAQPRGPMPDLLAQAQLAALGPAVAYPGQRAGLADLTARLQQPGADEVELLFIFTPADAAAHSPEFAAALAATQAETIRFTHRPADATAALCLYTIPLTHYLEEWGAEADAAGNLCLRQPVTQPLVPTLAEAEALHALLHDGELPPPGGISTARQWVHRVCPQASEALRLGWVPSAAPLPHPLPQAEHPTPYLHPLFADGRYLHNAWLREAYDPISGTAGAPAVYLPGTWGSGPPAVRLGKHTLPACSLPGLAAPCLPMLPGITTADTPEPLEHSPYPTRPLLPMPPQPPTTPRHPGGNSPQWGLIIDYTRCVGCQACTIACRAENNIPTVGPDEQKRGRDLQWLHLRRYLQPTTGHLYCVPAPCRQCRQAPCEAVCPVNATVHTSSGLSAMIYPRCWGTRYCAAACPYQARSFNYHDYAARAHTATALPPNPNVTVRTRGIMEKCSCCIQRIQAAQRSGQPPRTACQLACPRGAIRLVNWATEPLPPGATARFDTPGTHPATIYTQATPT